MPSTKMVIGKMDHRLEIKSPTFTKDPETLEEIPTYTTIAKVWGERLKDSSDEDFEGRQPLSIRMVRFRIRYRDDLNELMMITVNGKNYQIMGIEELDRRASMIINAEYRDNG